LASEEASCGSSNASASEPADANSKDATATHASNATDPHQNTALEDACLDAQTDWNESSVRDTGKRAGRDSQGTKPGGGQGGKEEIVSSGASASRTGIGYWTQLLPHSVQ